MATVFGPKRSLLGNIYAGGTFTDYDSTGYQFFTKFDSSYNLYTNEPYSATSFDSNVRSIVSYTSRRVLIGGQFSSYNGESNNLLVSIDFDGYPDRLFKTYSKIEGTYVKTIAVDKYDRVIIGGLLTGYNGTYTVGNIMRLNSDGSYDTSFNTGTGFDAEVNSIAIQNDGKILVGGEFTTFTGDSAYQYIVRLNEDGSIDGTFSIPGLINNFINTILFDSYDGTIIVGGEFNDAGSGFMARLTTNGDTVITDYRADNSVITLAFDSKRRILAGGSFGFIFVNKQRDKLVRINSDDTSDDNFDTKDAFDQRVRCVDVDLNDNVYAGGQFTTYRGNTANRLIKLDGLNADKIEVFNYTDNQVSAVLISNQ